jgi:myo-inositol catabolism protein IolC
VNSDEDLEIIDAKDMSLDQKKKLEEMIRSMTENEDDLMIEILPPEKQEKKKKKKKKKARSS